MNQVSAFDLRGKKGLVLGLANDHSIAWGCGRQARAMGAEVVASCLNEKARTYVEPLTESLGIDLQTCNIETPEDLEKLVSHAVGHMGGLDFVIHSIAWAPLEDLHGRVVDSSSVGFARAMEVSCHSFATLAKLCAPHMTKGGSMITMSFLGAQEAVPHYGMMGTIKAALAINAPTAWPMVKPPASPALAKTAAPGVLQATITGLRIINDGMAVVRPMPMLIAQTQEANISCVAPKACAA
jgi:enoyl-[acyl-carrier protein] reductase I